MLPAALSSAGPWLPGKPLGCEPGLSLSEKHDPSQSCHEEPLQGRTPPHTCLRHPVIAAPTSVPQQAPRRRPRARHSSVCRGCSGHKTDTTPCPPGTCTLVGKVNKKQINADLIKRRYNVLLCRRIKRGKAAADGTAPSWDAQGKPLCRSDIWAEMDYRHGRGPGDSLGGSIPGRGNSSANALRQGGCWPKDQLGARVAGAQ